MIGKFDEISGPMCAEHPRNESGVYLQYKPGKQIKDKSTPQHGHGDS